MSVFVAIKSEVGLQFGGNGMIYNFTREFSTLYNENI